MSVKRFVCLLRGVNVGSRNRISMAKLREILSADEQLTNIDTYIQSGNIVFSSNEECLATLSSYISDSLSQHSVSTAATLLSIDELSDIIHSNPYPDAASDPRTLHVYLLASEPDHRDWQALTALCSSSEKACLRSTGTLYYLFLHAPDGIGRSKFVSKMENILNMSATGRNWRTMQQLLILGTQENKVLS